MAKFYVDGSGKYLGTFDGVWVQDPADEDGELPPPRWVFPNIPVGAVEVPSPPTDYRQTYANGAWQPLPANANATTDLATLNAMLLTEGSVFRSLGLTLFDAINQQSLVVLDEINKLRAPATPYTVAQFKSALVAKGKTPFYTMSEFLAALQANMRN